MYFYGFRLLTTASSRAHIAKGCEHSPGERQFISIEAYRTIEAYRWVCVRDWCGQRCGSSDCSWSAGLSVSSCRGSTSLWYRGQCASNRVNRSARVFSESFSSPCTLPRTWWKWSPVAPEISSILSSWSALKFLRRFMSTFRWRPPSLGQPGWTTGDLLLLLMTSTWCWDGIEAMQVRWR